MMTEERGLLEVPLIVTWSFTLTNAGFVAIPLRTGTVVSTLKLPVAVVETFPTASVAETEMPIGTTTFGRVGTSPGCTVYVQEMTVELGGFGQVTCAEPEFTRTVTDAGTSLTAKLIEIGVAEGPAGLPTVPGETETPPWMEGGVKSTSKFAVLDALLPATSVAITFAVANPSTSPGATSYVKLQIPDAPAAAEG